MEAPYPPVMGPSPFFYYNPDPHPDHRQHGHFSPHPQRPQYVRPLPFLPEVAKQYTPSFSYDYGQFAPYPGMLYHHQTYVQQPMLTPIPSPQPVYQRPTNLPPPMLYPLDTNCGPSTPPLSASSSVVNSPPSSSSTLPTPVHWGFSRECLVGVKEGCEGDVMTELLAGNEWSRSQSPPLTPGMFLLQASREFKF